MYLRDSLMGKLENDLLELVLMRDVVVLEFRAQVQ